MVLQAQNSSAQASSQTTTTATMPQQRPFFLSNFFAAFRQQTPNSALSPQQPSKQTSTTASYTTSASAPRAMAASAASQAAARPSGVVNQLSLHSPRAGIPIPSRDANRRRGSDSSSEGFRDVRGADKLYIGGRTAAGEERFFKLGVVKRIRSNDRLSLDRLSL